MAIPHGDSRALPLVVTRRGLLLGAGAAPLLAGAQLPAGAAAHATAQVASSRSSPGAHPLPVPVALSAGEARRFVALRARLDGRPVFGIARGTDIAIVAGRSLPLRGNLILQATRAIDTGDGHWELPYVETTLLTDPASFRPLAEWENPLDGRRRAVPPPRVSLARLRMSAGGALSNRLELPDGTTIDYDGHVALQSGMEGADWAAQTLHFAIRRPGLAPEEAFVTTTHTATGRARSGFQPADSHTVSARPTLPAALAGGRDGLLVSSYFGRKYASADRLRRTLDPAQQSLLAPFFDQWRSLLP